MKTKSFCFFTLLLLCSGLAKSQDAKNVISVDGFGFFFIMSSEYRINLGYERAINPWLSAFVSLEKGKYNHVTESNGGGTLLREGIREGYAFWLESRVYPFRNNRIAPRGFFMGLYFQNYFFNEKINTYPGYMGSSPDYPEENFTSSGIGLNLGYKIGRGMFTFEPLFGLAKCWDSGIENKEMNEFIGYFPTSTFPRLELRIGLAF